MRENSSSQVPKFCGKPSWKNEWGTLYLYPWFWNGIFKSFMYSDVMFRCLHTIGHVAYMVKHAETDFTS